MWAGDIHARSGRVALPRTKVVPANPALIELDGAAARRAERRAPVRRSVVDMMDAIDGVSMVIRGVTCLIEVEVVVLGC